MKYFLSFFLLITAGTANAAVVDTFFCSVTGTGTLSLNASATLNIPRQPVDSSVGPNYESAQGYGSLTATNLNSSGIEVGITLGIDVNYLMQIDSNGKLIRAGENICMGPAWQLGNQRSAISCSTSSSSTGGDPFVGYTSMNIQNGVAYFVPTGALKWAGDLDGYGHVSLSCLYQSTLE